MSRALLTALVAMSLAGCLNATRTISSGGGVGGGGGGGGGGGSSCTGATEFDYKIPGTQFCAYGLGLINADAAYAKGATGAGITVAVIDTGIDPTHIELDAAGKISADSIDIVRGGTLTDEDGHGTHVSGIIAAERNGIATHGVAYNASIMAIRADTRGTTSAECGGAPPPCSFFQDADIAAALDHAATNLAQVINMSLGGTAPLSATSETALVNAMATGAIVVAATGNDGAGEPGWPAAYAGDATINASGQMIAVGAVDETGTITGFSSRCGATADFCLVAPGDLIISDYPGNSLAVASGTSQAAPFVSGAAALVLELAPTLTPAQVVQILLTSATDLGLAGVDAIYGHGLLNLQTAVAPLGDLVIPLTNSTTGASVDVDSTILVLGTAFGDALTNVTLLGSAFALDDFDRPYITGLDQSIARPGRGFGLLALRTDEDVETFETALPGGLRLTMGVAGHDDPDPQDSATVRDEERDSLTIQGFSLSGETAGGTAYRFGYNVTPEQQIPGLAGREAASLFWMPADVLAPQHALVGAGDGLALSRQISPRTGLDVGWIGERSDGAESARDAEIGEVALTHSFTGGASVTTGISLVGETDGFLGSVSAGGFAVDGSNSHFYTFGATLPLGGGIDLIGNYTLGTAQVTADGTSLLSDWGRVRADAFGLGMVKRGVLGTGDRIGLLMGQPLRVSAARATLTAPTGFTMDKTVIQESERVSLVPSGREIDFQLAYDTGLGPASNLSSWVMVQLQPGHVATAEPAYGVGIRLSTGF